MLLAILFLLVCFSIAENIEKLSLVSLLFLFGFKIFSCPESNNGWK
mgnify:CR=1 FL=1